MLKRKSLLVGALSTALLVIPLTNVSAKTPTVQQLQAQIVSLQNQVNQQKKIINQDNTTISNLQNQLKGSIVTKGDLPSSHYNEIQEVPYPVQGNLEILDEPKVQNTKLTMKDFNQLQLGQIWWENEHIGYTLVAREYSPKWYHSIETWKIVGQGSGNWIEVYVNSFAPQVIGVSKGPGVN
jgi:hypothetical protein